MPRKSPEVAPKDDAEPGSGLLTFVKVAAPFEQAKLLLDGCDEIDRWHYALGMPLIVRSPAQRTCDPSLLKA